MDLKPGEFWAIPMPWPESPTLAQFAAGATVIGMALADAENPTDAERGRITAEITIATSRVQQYAPSAPLAIRQEAASRFYGYLKDAPSGAYGKQDLNLDSVSVNRTYQYSHAALFRNCGAAALLTPWREWSAGHIEKDDD
ncbi:MAG: hypothetical protein OXF66_02125 [Gammaproteobacteria bacterium]|nr:hypothetical protein [Gammaproteobacteria bacterium]